MAILAEVHALPIPYATALNVPTKNPTGQFVRYELAMASQTVASANTTDKATAIDGRFVKDRAAAGGPIMRLKIRRAPTTGTVIASTILVRASGWRVPVIGKLSNALHLPLIPHLGQIPELASAALAVAVLSSIESLLSAKVADGMADVAPANLDRELVGQGLGNIVSSLLGGMPATGAIARTAVNARAGARTRLSAVVHSLTLLIVVLGASSLVGQIPLAALAAVLMVTSFRMVNRLNVVSVLHSTRSDGSVLVATAVATVATNLIVAIEIGIAVASAMALRHVARSTKITAERLSAGRTEDANFDLVAQHILVYKIDGTLFFGATQRFLQAFTEVSDVRVVLLRLADVKGLDATGALALGEIIEDLERRHITVLIKGLRPEFMRILGAVGAIDRLAHVNHSFDNLELAVAHAHLHAERITHPSPR
jgi:SulP family sulfate permease